MPSTQQVVEEAAFADTVGRVVAAGGVFVQDARFQPRAILFVDQVSSSFCLRWVMVSSMPITLNVEARIQGTRMLIGLGNDPRHRNPRP